MSTGLILDIQEYGSVDGDTGELKPYEDVWYVDFKLQPEEEDGLFGRYSLAYSMKSIQDIFSDIFTTILQGHQVSAFGIPVVIGDVGAKTFDTVKPGEVLHISDPNVKVQNIAQPFTSVGLFQLLELCFKLSDRLTGIGGLATGQPANAGTTATEIDALVTAIEAAQDQHTQGVTDAVRRVYGLILMYLRHHYWDLKRVYGDEVVISEEALAELGTIRIEPTGQSASSSPGALIRKLMGLKQIADANPNLGIDTRVVLRLLIDAMDLPVTTEALMLTDQEKLLVATMGITPMELDVAMAMASQNAGQQNQGIGGGPSPLNGGIPPMAGPQGAPPQTQGGALPDPSEFGY
jgi:hypothetical protein